MKLTSTYLRQSSTTIYIRDRYGEQVIRFKWLLFKFDIKITLSKNNKSLATPLVIILEGIGFYKTWSIEDLGDRFATVDVHDTMIIIRVGNTFLYYPINNDQILKAISLKTIQKFKKYLNNFKWLLQHSTDF